MGGDPILMGEMFIGKACKKCVNNIMEKYAGVMRVEGSVVQISTRNLRALLEVAHRCGRQDSCEQRQLIKAASGMSEAELFDHA